MDKETKKYALIWIAVLLFIYYCKKTNEKIEEFTGEPLPGGVTGVPTGLRIMYDSDGTNTVGTGNDYVLNGVNVVQSQLTDKKIPIDASSAIDDGNILSEADETNQAFLQRCNGDAQKPDDATHLLVTIKLPDTIADDETLSDFTGLMQNTLSAEEGSCTYYRLEDGDLADSTNFSRNVIDSSNGGQTIPLLFAVDSEVEPPNPCDSFNGSQDSCPPDSCNFTPAVDAADATCTGERSDGSDCAAVTAAFASSKAEADCPTSDGCSYTAPRVASDATCELTPPESQEVVDTPVVDTPVVGTTVDTATVDATADAADSDPCAIDEPTAATCPAELCIFTPGVTPVAESCNGGTECEILEGQAACEAEQGCSYTAAVPAVDPTCVKKTLDDVIRSTNDILNKLQEFDSVLSELDSKLSTDDSETASGVTPISQKIKELLTPEILANKTVLGGKITEVVAEVNALKSQIGTSDTSVTSELDSLTEIVSALTASVANMDNITESRIKTCSNKTGVNGGTDKYDCSNTEYGLNTNGICGESDCTDEICCTITKDAPPPPDPSPTEEPSEWVTYVIIAVIIGIIIGLGYMLKG